MNVLFLGVYRDGTGWARGAIEYIRALHEADVRVVPRPIKLNKVQGEVPALIRAFEERRCDRYDAVIQNVLPHHMDYCGRIPKNIGLYYVESDNFRASSWTRCINNMDGAWVCCRQNKHASIDSGVTTPINVVPIPTDTAKFEKKYEPISLREKLVDNFIFYTIGEFNRRKNLATIVRAFHTEFDLNEPVSLVIKTTSRSGDQDYDTTTKIQQFCNGLKQSMKLYPSIDNYKKEIIIVGRHSDKEILRLHASCDCFVSPSFGEAWCIPAFDAMAMGKTPIVTGWGGFPDYMTDDCGWLLPYQLEQVFGTQEDTFNDLHTGWENWARVSVDDLRSAMRTAYEADILRKEKSLNGKDRAYDFTYEKVGALMKGLLT